MDTKTCNTYQYCIDKAICQTKANVQKSQRECD